MAIWHMILGFQTSADGLYTKLMTYHVDLHILGAQQTLQLGGGGTSHHAILAQKINQAFLNIFKQMGDVQMIGALKRRHLSSH